MIYLHLKSTTPFPPLPSSAATITPKANVIETHLGNELDTPFSTDQSIPLVGPYLDQYNQETLLNTFCVVVGIQHVIQVDRTINTVLTELGKYAEEVLPDCVGFEHEFGNIFFGSAVDMFPAYRKQRTNEQPALTRFVVVDFNIYKMEKAFGFPMYANFLRSPMFWTDLHKVMRDVLLKINVHDNPVFAAVKQRVFKYAGERINSLNAKTV
jgi:hypothetical protein